MQDGRDRSLTPHLYSLQLSHAAFRRDEMQISRWLILSQQGLKRITQSRCERIEHTTTITEKVVENELNIECI